MWKYIKRVLLGIGIILIFFLGFQYYKFFIGNQMSSGLVAKAEEAFKSGVIIEDPKNDFLTKAEMGAEMDIDKPYNYTYLDLKSLTLGADDKYLFVKISFYDTIPRSPSTTNRDTITSVSSHVGLVDENGLNYALLGTNYGWIPKVKIFSLNTWYLTGPTGIIWPEEDRFEKENRDSKMFGGEGYDYVISAYPLDKLGIRPGQKIIFSEYSEARSEKYTHATVDFLLGQGKEEDLITWIVGTKNFTISEFINNSGDGDDPKKNDKKK